MNLRTYIDQKRGMAAYLARLLGVSQTLISQWASGHRPIPAERCPEIEKATSASVTCEEMRPDVDWPYLRGSNPPAKESAND